MPVTVVGAESCTVKLAVPKVYFKHIVGAQQAKKKALEEEFGCELKIPTRDSQEEEIEIRSSSKEAAENAANGLKVFISKIRETFRPTHFIAVPVLHEDLQKDFENFKETVLAKTAEKADGYESICEELFQRKTKLHFTLATLTLLDQEEIDRSGRLLKEFAENCSLLGKKPLSLTVEGVGCFQKNLEEARVFFGKPRSGNEQTQRLQDLATNISDFFTNQGLHSHRRVLGTPPVLHMTLLKATKKTPPRYCATGMMSAYAKHIFIENAQCRELCVCKMNSTDPETLFYHREASIDWTT